MLRRLAASGLDRLDILEHVGRLVVRFLQRGAVHARERREDDSQPGE
jgi:hypothetical protein